MLLGCVSTGMYVSVASQGISLRVSVFRKNFRGRNQCVSTDCPAYDFNCVVSLSKPRCCLFSYYCFLFALFFFLQGSVSQLLPTRKIPPEHSRLEVEGFIDLRI